MKPELQKASLPIIKILIITAVAFFLYVPLMAQTFFGISSTPADNGTQAGTTATVVPPASMLTGDLVIIYAHYRNASGSFSISTSGGQTWNTGTTTTGSNQAYFIAWCRFNGTWMTDPVVTGSGSGSVALTAVMYVFRPTNPLNKWGVNVAQTNNTASGSNPNTINSITTTLPNTVTMAFWCSAAANTWGTLSGTDWSKTGLPDQVRNTTGSDQSQTAAYRIMSAAGATGNVSQTQSATTTALKTIMSWHEVPNDDCANATSVTVNAGTTCTVTTTSTTTGATQSATGCSGTADDDVWFSFTATDYQHTITATPAASGGISNIVLEVFSNCTGASLGCVNATSGTSAETTTLYGLTPGATYYYRVYSSASGSGTGLFTTCVTTALPATPANVSTGKSFINISRPGGGTVVPGDELEIRVSVNVSNAGTNNIFRLRFNDTLPANVTYVSGSLKLLTNEAKVYAAYTDNAGDDAAMYNSVNRTIRFNLGRDTTNQSRGVVSNTGIDSSSGGYVRSNTHAPRGNGMLVIVTYRVTVDVSTAYNTIINYSSGTIRYRNQLPATGAIDYTLAPNTLSFIVYPNYGLCSNATGSNSITAGNGDFGSGTSQNASNPGTVPGYTYLSIAANAPNDGSYSVIKNLSPNQLTDPTVARPNTTSGNRVFGVWDIIGDHTGASDPLAGNPPSASGANGGYMLAVNAAYQLSVANNQTITGLCENTYYEFSAWFRNVCKRCGSDSLGRGASSTSPPAGYIPTAPGDSSGVKPNLTFQIDGIDYYVSGDIDYTGQWGQWVKKGFVFMTGSGQTSLTISIKNNAPGGGGNDWVMDDISFVTCLPNLQFFPTASNQVCENSVVEVSSIVNTFFDNYMYYQWERSTDNGVTWSAAPLKTGIDSFQYVNSGGINRDTLYYPQFVANASQNGHQYRLRVATTTSNLSNNECNVYQAAEIVTLNITTCTVLPVTLTQFNGQLLNNRSRLFWATQNETTETAYVLERSNDGITFFAIGTVSAKNTAGGPSYYEFNDPQLLSGKAYYRLKMINRNNSKYSHTIQLSVESNLFEVRLLSNPFQQDLKFEVLSSNTSTVHIQLLDMYGRKIKEKTQKIYAGTTGIILPDLTYLQKGTYILAVKTGTATITRQVQNH
jgi:trimeric autotransporter adhesin